MDYAPLVTVDLNLGKKIVDDLEAEGIQVPVAFWAKLEEYGEWRFFLASPEFDRMGLFQAYGWVAGAGHAEQTFNLPIITILDMDDALVQGLRKQAKSQHNVRGLHVVGQAFGARSIEDGILEKVA